MRVVAGLVLIVAVVAAAVVYATGRNWDYSGVTMTSGEFQINFTKETEPVCLYASHL